MSTSPKGPITRQRNRAASTTVQPELILPQAKPKRRQSNRSASTSKSKSKSKTPTSDTEWCPCRTGTTVDNRHWIQCSYCTQWWHVECLGLTDTELALFTEAPVSDSASSDNETKNPYRCPTCQISALSRNSRIINLIQSSVTAKALCGSSVPGESLHNSTTHTPNPPIPNTIDSNNLQPITSSSPIPYGASHPGQHIVILDKITPQDRLKKSSEIKKEIATHKPDLHFRYTYPLPGGGIAIHCNSAEDEEKALKDWPKDSFGSPGLVAHRPSRSVPNKTVVVKSVSTHLTEENIKLQIDSQCSTSVEVKRFWSNQYNKPIPVISVTFPTSAQAGDAIDKGLRINERVHPCEAKRSFKVIRCLYCQQFGHQAATCRGDKRCQRCSKDHIHSHVECTAVPHCSNCGGGHPASSSHCPTFQHYFTKLKSRSLIHNETPST